jgi:hypothetical protein
MKGQGAETHQIAGGDVRKTTHVACEISGSVIAFRIEQSAKF